MELRIYTDGGARGNPGPAASGVVIKKLEDGKEIELEHIGKFLGIMTNNQAEYSAAVIGLEYAKKLGADVVELVMDSELVVKQLNGEYKVKDRGLAERFLEIHNLRHHFKRVNFRHVRRELNHEADAIVNEVLDREVKKL
jgi:ribonuclease HI